MALMSLGMFAFALDSVPFESLARKTSWRFGRSERIGAHAAAQFLGPGEETISLAGIVAPPDVGAYGSLDLLRRMAAEGEAHQLVDGEGRVYGSFTIESLDEQQSAFLAQGLPRKVDFTLELARVEARAGDRASVGAIVF